MTNALRDLLFRHSYFIADSADIPDTVEQKKLTAYFNSFLLTNYYVIVDKPQLVTESMLDTIKHNIYMSIPASFYANPQDTKYYNTTELLLEQLVSYFLVETGTGFYRNPELFKKTLPDYPAGTDALFRYYQIITKEEAEVALNDIFNAYCSYTRPFSPMEKNEFLELYNNNYWKGQKLSCRDNILALLPYNADFAYQLDKKDLVKYSVKKFGKHKDLVSLFTESEKLLFKNYISKVFDCPLSKKQAKYFNALAKICKASVRADNEKSVYKAAEAAMRAGDVYKAAQIFEANGSLLLRNIKYLLSRADIFTAPKILDLLPEKNPLALYQLIKGLTAPEIDHRIFKFTVGNVKKVHKETDYEARWRKSRLNEAMQKFLSDYATEKLIATLKASPSLGKVYIADNFYKLGIPDNTAATGKGLSILPTGSRVPCKCSNVRTFVYWTGIYDIDASVSFIKVNSTINKVEDTLQINFSNYAYKSLGNDVLFSGDCRDSKGSEFFDLKLDAIKTRGYNYVIYAINGYEGNLNKGEVYCGYQDKSNLNTAAWDPKNIAMQTRIFGDSPAAAAFAIDLASDEIIVLNTVLTGGRTINPSVVDPLMTYMSPDFLKINMGMFIENRGEVVSDPAEADIVFDDAYLPADNQKTVRSYEIEKLVQVVNF